MAKKKVVQKKPQEPKSRRAAERWTEKLLRDGFTPVSSFFLENYHRLKPEISHGEAMFIIHLISFKWDNQMPYPAFKTLAKRMLMKDAQARNLARKLDTKGYLKRHIRVSQTNRFDLSPLFVALEKLYDETSHEHDNENR